MIPFLAARAMTIMPSPINDHLRVLSGDSVANGPLLSGTHHESQTITACICNGSPFKTARVIGIELSLIDHFVRFPLRLCIHRGNSREGG